MPLSYPRSSGTDIVGPWDIDSTKLYRDLRTGTQNMGIWASRDRLSPRGGSAQRVGCRAGLLAWGAKHRKATAKQMVTCSGYEGSPQIGLGLRGNYLFRYCPLPVTVCITVGVVLRALYIHIVTTIDYDQQIQLISRLLHGLQCPKPWSSCRSSRILRSHFSVSRIFALCFSSKPQSLTYL